jgi:hypothetical protein
MVAGFPGKKKERETGFESVPHSKNTERTTDFDLTPSAVQHLVQQFMTLLQF